MRARGAMRLNNLRRVRAPLQIPFDPGLGSYRRSEPGDHEWVTIYLETVPEGALRT